MQPTYDFVFWRALIACAIALALGIAALVFIRKGDSGAGSWGDGVEWFGILLWTAFVWFFTTVFQPIVFVQGLRELNPWQIELLTQPDLPSVNNTDPKVDFITPKDPDIGDEWYIMYHVDKNAAKEGIPVAKKRKEGLIWFQDGTTSRTQQLP